MESTPKTQKSFGYKLPIPIDVQELSIRVCTVLSIPSRSHAVGIPLKLLLDHILCYVFLVCSFAYGAPYWGEKIEVRQPDGTKVPIVVFGDEFFHYVETPYGYPLIRDPQTGWIQYAVVNDTGDDFEPTGLIYDPTHPVDAEDARIQAFLISHGKEKGTQYELNKHQRLPAEVVREKARKNRQLLGREITYSVEDGTTYSYNATAMNPPAPLSGSITGLTVLIQFPDELGTITSTEVTNFCNQEGYTENGNNGSVRDYFYSVSNGQLTYTNVVKGYYTATHNKSYYTNPSRPYGASAEELIIEALNWLDNPNGQNYDFSDISKDKKNKIIALNVFYVGFPDSAWAEGLWPHQGSMSRSFTSNEGVKPYTYQITNMDSALPLRTFCHENGHMICGFPDLYDYDFDSYGAGFYCLMGYRGTPNPVPPNAYFRHLKGWETVTDLDPSSAGIQSITANTNTSYRYLNPNNSNEFFMIESRRRSGWSSNLPDEGLLIWHIDTAFADNSKQDMTAASHYRVSVEQADNAFHLERNVNTGDDGDLYHAGYKVQFHFQTSPSSAWWDGTDSRLRIINVSEISDTMSFTLESLRYSGGSGTEANPYQISTIADWQELIAASADWGKQFVLLNDIDFGGASLTPIGNVDTKFTGVLDGAGHTLSNLKINQPDTDYVGLFGYVWNGQVKDLGVVNANIAGQYRVGGLVGVGLGTITSCYATGTVSGNSIVGGLAGLIGGTMTSCYSAGTVTGNGDNVGGLVGRTVGDITSCYAIGTVSGNTDVGGLVGSRFSEAIINGCFWDIQTSGQITSAGATGKTTAEMKTLSTFTLAAWDFVGESANGTADVWRMCGDGVDYPRLSWEFSQGGDFDCPDGVAMDDLLYLAARWLATTPDTSGPADANHDGQVNLSDFAILAENWLEGS